MKSRQGVSKAHKHCWSKQYRGIFNGPVRLCVNGRCGAMRFASGHIVCIRERVREDSRGAK